MHPKRIRPALVTRPIILALGSNLGSRAGGPQATLEAALHALECAGLRILARSSWHRTRAQPPSAQPAFLNGAVLVETALSPKALLALLHRIERRFGRMRRTPNEPRILDLDLIDYRGRVQPGGAGEPALPHPRVLGRPFVLVPLAEIHPAWRHPAAGRAAGGGSL
jgi:2-amino-4-hydroxy-6-hydroxymethyldihydropteridine diphosphokinase